MTASAVYEAEYLWSAVLDRGGFVDFHGSQLYVPMQRRFSDIKSIQTYVDRILAFQSVRESYPNAGAVKVRDRRGQKKAHYEPASTTIAIPIQNRLYGNECTVLHELAHHLSVSAGIISTPSGTRWHGVDFREAMLFLVSTVMGEQAALLLRSWYYASGARND